MSAALPVPQAARVLGTSSATLRRWIAAGAPVARRGRRGRGRATLVDPAAVMAWRRREGGTDALLILAARLPELLAQAAEQAHRAAPDKRDPVTAAWCLCAAWQLGVAAVVEVAREAGADIPDISAIPEAIERLRKIATR